jgi:hypothetical protein
MTAGSTPTAFPPSACSAILYPPLLTICDASFVKTRVQLPFLPCENTLQPPLEKSPVAIELFRSLVEIPAVGGEGGGAGRYDGGSSGTCEA